MPTASIYPRLTDTDAQLLRRTPSDAITPEDHNNLVDAIEQIEATVGVTDDGTGAGVPGTFRTSLTDFINFPSVAMANPRQPWAVMPANAWYGRQTVMPAAWALGAGAVADRTTWPGYTRLLYTGAANGIIASATVTGTGRWDLVARLVPQNLYGRFDVNIDVGFSATGTGGDITGFRCSGTSASGFQANLFYNNALLSGSPSFSVPLSGGALWVSCDGANVFYYVRTVLGNWLSYHLPQTGVFTPTKSVIRSGSVFGGGNVCMLDYIAQGNSAPTGA